MGCVSWCDYSGRLPTKDDPDSLLETWSIELSTFSDWFRNELLGTFHGEAPTYPADGQFYIAAHSGISTVAMAGNEITGDGMTRVPVTFERVTDIQRWNPNAVQTGNASGSGWTILSFSLWDHPVAGNGNYYAFGNLTDALVVPAGNLVKWEAEHIIVGMGIVIG